MPQVSVSEAGAAQELLIYKRGNWEAGAGLGDQVAHLRLKEAMSSIIVLQAIKGFCDLGLVGRWGGWGEQHSAWPQAVGGYACFLGKRPVLKTEPLFGARKQEPKTAAAEKPGLCGRSGDC